MTALLQAAGMEMMEEPEMMVELEIMEEMEIMEVIIMALDNLYALLMGYSRILPIQLALREYQIQF